MRLPEEELAELDAASLRRKLPEENTKLTNFSSNDYLGLSQHPRIVQAYQTAIHKYGAGSTASRLICGNRAPHSELESFIATAKKTEASLSFSNGYATSIGTLTAILKKGDTVILDKLCHASLIDGARMSGATIRVFPHNDLSKLEKLLAKVSAEISSESRTLVVTESVFSMDGDTAKLKEIVALVKNYRSLLMVDEAHGLGVLGQTGLGLAEELGLQNQIDFQMGTLGKAAGVAGGYIAASQAWIDLLVNKSRSLIYSTAPPPGQAAAAHEALKIITSDEGAKLRTKLWHNIHLFAEAAMLSAPPTSSIIPWVVGSSDEALALAAKLRSHGYLIPAIRFPTVPKSSARLRITLSATHSEKDILALAGTLNTQ